MRHYLFTGLYNTFASHGCVHAVQARTEVIPYDGDITAIDAIIMRSADGVSYFAEISEAEADRWKNKDKTQKILEIYRLIKQNNLSRDDLLTMYCAFYDKSDMEQAWDIFIERRD